MEFVALGPNQGRDVSLGQFKFERGVCIVPDDAKDAHNLLKIFYNCHPVSDVEVNEETGQIQVKQVIQDRKVSAQELMARIRQNRTTIDAQAAPPVNDDLRKLTDSFYPNSDTGEMIDAGAGSVAQPEKKKPK